MGGGDQESSTSFQLAPEQRDILQLAMPFLESVGTNPPQPPSGTAIAPFNPIQEGAQSGALGMVPLLGDYAANAWDGNQFLSGGDVLGSTPFNSQFDKVAAGSYGWDNPAWKTLHDAGVQRSMPDSVKHFFTGMRNTGGGEGPTSSLTPWTQGKMFGQTGTEDFLKQLMGGNFSSPALAGVSPLASGEGTRNPVLDMLGMFTSGDLMNVETNPALKNAIDAATRPIVENTLRQALPAVRQDFIGAGQYGGTKQGLAEAQAINEMQKNVGDTSSLMANRAYETGMQGTLQGLGLYSDAFAQGIGQQLEALGLQDSVYGRDIANRIQGAQITQDAYTRDIQAMLQSAGLQDTAFGRKIQNRIQSGLALDAASARDIQNDIAIAGLQDTAFGRQMSAILDAASMQSQAHGQELDAMIKGLGLAPQTAGLGLLPWQTMSAVGDTQHGMDMARQQEAYQQQQLAQMWQMMLGQELAGTVGLIPGGTNISSTEAPSLNPFSAALGGLSLFSGLGPLMGLF